MLPNTRLKLAARRLRNESFFSATQLKRDPLDSAIELQEEHDMASRARRNLFVSATLMSFLLAAAFKLRNGFQWFWADQPVVAALLVGLGILFAVMWARAQKDLQPPSIT